MRFLLTLLSCAFAGVAVAWSATDCPCDPAKPDTLKLRQCSLCVEAEKQPQDLDMFFLKDASPRKPNRLLLLPRRHSDGIHPLAELDDRMRIKLWTVAIAKSKELWGDDWGVAYNGDKVRTQCHTHIHIGKMLKGVEEGKFVVVRRPSQIPRRPGEGLWIHPVGRTGRMHVHYGEQACETVLMR